MTVHAPRRITVPVSWPAIPDQRPDSFHPEPGDHGPRVLVASASRHGSTREVAAALARALRRSAAGRCGGLSAELVPVELRSNPSFFDAVVLGSAVYAGRWLEPAQAYVSAVASALRSRSTWLFSSGLVCYEPMTSDEDGNARWIAESLSARGHQVFPGRVERRLLSAAERRLWDTESASTGDFRDWRSIHQWAEEIATDLVIRQAVPIAG